MTIKTFLMGSLISLALFLISSMVFTIRVLLPLVATEEIKRADDSLYDEQPE